jgi:hypothetical protein
MPVGCTDSGDEFGGCWSVGRIRLVTTSFSPHAARYWEESRSTNSFTSGRA